MPTVNEYLSSITPSQKAEFKRVRNIVKQLVPDAKESISYGIPAFKYMNKPLIYFGAFKNHMSIFPASDAMVEVVGDEILAFRTSKGTLRFTENHRIPDTMLREIIRFRLVEIS